MMKMFTLSQKVKLNQDGNNSDNDDNSNGNDLGKTGVANKN